MRLCMRNLLNDQPKNRNTKENESHKKSRWIEANTYKIGFGMEKVSRERKRLAECKKRMECVIESETRHITHIYT